MSRRDYLDRIARSLLTVLVGVPVVLAVFVSIIGLICGIVVFIGLIIVAICVLIPVAGPLVIGWLLCFPLGLAAPALATQLRGGIARVGGRIGDVFYDSFMRLFDPFDYCFEAIFWLLDRLEAATDRIWPIRAF